MGIGITVEAKKYGLVRSDVLKFNLLKEFLRMIKKVKKKTTDNQMKSLMKSVYKLRCCKYYEHQHR